MLGSIIIYFLVLLAVVFSIPAASHTGLMNWISFAGASAAFCAMGLNIFLATRPKIIEGAFGGLDRIYDLHKNLGIVTLLGTAIHFFIEPSFEGPSLSFELNKLAKEVAEIAVWVLVALIIGSLVKRIPFLKFEFPYHIWRQAHRLMGIVFIAIAFHQFFIKRPFDGTALLANYLNLIALIGIVAFIITQIAPFFRRKPYEITFIEKLPVATVIEAKPLGSALKSKPGQFAFISIPEKGLGEEHPFTIAGQSPTGALKFAIKPLGDFTAKLREQVALGDKMHISGGYGRFIFSEKEQRQIWLAGGIGITPLLSMATGLTNDLKSKIFLVHCVRNRQEAVEYELLVQKAKEIENFEFHLFESDTQGRLNFESLSQLTDIEMDGAGLWFCGPPPLRAAIEKGARQANKKFSKVHFEKFEFR